MAPSLVAITILYLIFQQKTWICTVTKDTYNQREAGRRNMRSFMASTIAAVIHKSRAQRPPLNSPYEHHEQTGTETIVHSNLYKYDGNAQKRTLTHNV